VPEYDLVSLGYDELRDPIVLIRIGGKPVDELERRRVRFNFHRKHGKPAECKMTFRDTDRALANGALLQPGDVWEIRWGYWGDISAAHVLTLKSWKPNYDANSARVDIVFRVTRGRKSNSLTKQSRYGTELEHTFAPKNWGVIQSSEVAKKLARRHNLKFKGSDSGDALKNAPLIQPGNMSDAEYLQQLAFDIDFEVFVEDNTLFYRSKPYNEAPRRVLWYHGSESYLLSFNPQVKIVSESVEPRWAKSAQLRLKKVQATKKVVDIAAVGQIAGAFGSIFGIDQSIINNASEAILTSPGFSGSVPTGNSQPGTEGVVGFSTAVKALEDLGKEHEDMVANSGIVGAGPGVEKGTWNINGFDANASKIQVDTRSKAASTVKIVAPDDALTAKIAAAPVKRKIDKAVTADATVIGSPRFRNRTNLRFEGVGRRFSANWYVREDDQSIDESNAYVVKLKLKRGSLDDTQGPKVKKTEKEEEKPKEETKAVKVLAINGVSGLLSKVVTRFEDRDTSVPQS